jgi:hypothetical protein
MPANLTDNMGGMEPTPSYVGASKKEYNYRERYPNGMDLSPGSADHNKILMFVLNRAREARESMEKRYDDWREIDKMLTVYIPTSEEEEKVKEIDERKPISIVVPMTFTVLDTLLTYFTAAFLNDPIFRYEPGGGSEDAVGAALMEHVIDRQMKKSKAALELHTSWRDSFSYGFSVLAPSWVEYKAYRTRRVQQSRWSAFLSKYIPGEVEPIREEITRYEGNELSCIDPYLFLPDPNFSVHDVQRMEYVSWLDRTSQVNLEELEAADDGFFNAKHLRHMDGLKSTLYPAEDGRESRYYGRTSKDISTSYSKPVDIIWMYAKIIPKEYKLSDKDSPEKWMFAVAADKVVIAARPLGLDHDMYPLAVAAPDYDGHGVAPISRLETIFGMQTTMNWLFNSHIANVRKAINDMLVVDPYLINMQDLSDPQPGKLIRMRRAAWGLGMVDKAVAQLKVADITSNNLGEASMLMDIAHRSSAATDIVQGIMRTSGERRSATEARDSRTGALSRIERLARITSIQCMTDLGYMMASHTQQLMTEDVYIKTVGRYEDLLVSNYGADRAKVRPQDLDVDYDVVIHDGTTPGGESSEMWVNLYQILAQNPQVAAQFDMFRIFKHIATTLGAKSVDEFVKKGGGVQAEVQPQQQIEQGVQEGNLLPMGMGGM